jgi:hypothetical protein
MIDLELLADTMEEWSTTSGDHHMLAAAAIRQLAALQRSGEPVGEVFEVLCEGRIVYAEVYDGAVIPHKAKLYTTPQPVVPEWISVDERLPEEETPVLAIVDGYDGLLTVERRWERCNVMTEPYYMDFLYWDWVDNDGQDLEGKVRFWMRLPEMPALLTAGKETV